VDEIIHPALANGKIVLCDRYADSTIAYQGYGRGQSIPDLRTLWRFATGGLTPDLTILFDLDPLQGLRRKQDGDAAEWNRMEAEALAFHQRVRQGFSEMAKAEPARWFVVNAAKTIEALQEEILAQTLTHISVAQVAKRSACSARV